MSFIDSEFTLQQAPYHSFRNPAERVMSVLNLGLQSVGLARNAVDKDIEDAVMKCKSIRSKSLTHPVVFLYSDGGPNHRITYTSVKLALIALFLELNLDYLCAGLTAGLL